MTFEELALADAAGAILAHTMKLPNRVLHKGLVLDAESLSAIADAGETKVYAARLASDDVTEAEAAERIGALLAARNLTVSAPTNGRVDLFAAATGIVLVDRGIVDGVNNAQSAIQLATLPEHALAETGQIVATAKVVPFGVPVETMAAAEAAITSPPVSLSPLRALRVGMVATQTPALKPSIIDKTRKVLEQRLEPAKAPIIAERRVPHDPASVGAALAELRSAGCELLIAFGASATSDPRDVVPAGIVASGGAITRIGMPVDPGNLLVLGELDGIPIIGAPGCARSPAPSGFDWVLQRILAALPVTASDIAKMGVGGVLAEKRTQRVFAGDRTSARHRIDAIILAAGASSRMNGAQKLIAEIDGTPMVRRAVQAALDSVAASVTVVTGHSARDVARAVEGLNVTLIENTAFGEGLSTSVRAGVSALPEESDGAIILLGDMPDIDADIVNTMIDAFDPDLGKHIVVPTFEGKAGNPVLWSRRFFGELQALTGDMGAREMIRQNPDAVAWVKASSAVTHDVDTPEAMAAIGGRWT